MINKLARPERALTIFVLGLFFLVMDIPRILPFRVEYLGLFVFLGWVYLFHVRSRSYASVSLGWAERLVLLYLGWCLLSVVWSVSKIDTLYHTFLLLAIFFLARRFGCLTSDFSAALVARLYLVIALLCWVALIVAPSYALQQKGIWRLQGIVGHEQWLAIMMGTGLIDRVFRCDESFQHARQTS